VAWHWWSLFIAWAFYQTGSTLSGLWWWLNLVFFAPINIFLNIILVVNAGMDGKYMEAYWKVLGSFLFGLLIYVSYLSPNLQWYNLH
jgi:hypothetical protein